VSGTALALVLAAAVLHATWNLAVKGATGTDQVGFVWLYVAASSALWLPIGIVWAVATDARPTWWWLIGALVSALLHVVYQLVLQRGYAESDLNLVYPLARGAGPMLTFVVAVFVLGQRPGRVEVAGVLAVVGGVLLISFAGSRSTRSRGAERSGVVWGLATGATIAACWDSSSSCRSWPCSSDVAATPHRSVSSGRQRVRRLSSSRCSRRSRTCSCCGRCSWLRSPSSPPLASPASSSVRCSGGWCCTSHDRPGGWPARSWCWAGSA
jgi:multidrug transporter EmrE-like cation transporter